MAKLDVLQRESNAISLDPRQLPGVLVPGLYVHIPFCFHKCHYCDFYSITRQTPERMNRFVDLLMAELDRWLEAGTQRLQPRTIFFGGGTPSLLPIDAMQRLLDGLHSRLDLTSLVEWTIEVNPATADLDYLKVLRSYGVDRISMGAQSFVPSELATLERHHRPAEVERSVELCRDAGFQRMNIDLIYAIPGQTMDTWRLSLDRAIELKLEHYSCYNLTYEPNTPMAVKQRLGRIAEVEESVEIQMLLESRRRLTAIGCRPYEISNYAAPGQDCLHNLAYWLGESYLGLGPSGASHLDGVRFKNRSHLGEWERAIEAGKLAAVDVETLSDEQRRGEYMMLGLRLAQGVSLSQFASRFGLSLIDCFQTPIREFTRLGFLTVDTHVRLTEKGIAVADAIASEFL